MVPVTKPCQAHVTAGKSYYYNCPCLSGPVSVPLNVEVC